mmetsp:Transcript_9999/g.28290  ORF Transcript_9999/g.28290 Transcript_9999/m.28290 type:complete len:216 (-) Transcript_9999:828-1475(-)
MVASFRFRLRPSSSKTRSARICVMREASSLSASSRAWRWLTARTSCWRTSAARLARTWRSCSSRQAVATMRWLPSRSMFSSTSESISGRPSLSAAILAARSSSTAILVSRKEWRRVSSPSVRSSSRPCPMRAFSSSTSWATWRRATSRCKSAKAFCLEASTTRRSRSSSIEARATCWFPRRSIASRMEVRWRGGGLAAVRRSRSASSSALALRRA